MTEEENIYICINLKDLQKLIKIPAEINEIVWYMRSLKPGKFNYNLFENYEIVLQKYKKFLE